MSKSLLNSLIFSLISTADKSSLIKFLRTKLFLLSFEIIEEFILTLISELVDKPLGLDAVEEFNLDIFSITKRSLSGSSSEPPPLPRLVIDQDCREPEKLIPPRDKFTDSMSMSHFSKLFMSIFESGVDSL